MITALGCGDHARRRCSLVLKYIASFPTVSVRPYFVSLEARRFNVFTCTPIAAEISLRSAGPSRAN